MGEMNMCGRYQLDYNIEQLKMRFDAHNNYIGYEARSEVFPTETVAIITRRENKNVIEPAKWGLENQFIKRPLINARGETVDEKRTFKKFFLRSRCIIPATAFFEWKLKNNKKVKFQIRPTDAEIFGMAGLYETHIDSDGTPFMRCIIITAEANEAMSEIHQRMPVILNKENENIWMDTSINEPYVLKDFIKSYSGSLSFTAAAANSNYGEQIKLL
jgi:putative SOS response-associated peptidase YedK